MASGSKTTAVHFTLIFFVMLSVILGVVSYMYYDEERELRATAKASNTEATALKTANEKLRADATAFKRITGYTQTEVGTANSPQDGTISKAIKDDLAIHGGSLAQGNLKATIIKLNQEYINVSKQIETLNAELQKHKQQNIEARGEYDIKVVNSASAVKTAEEGLRQIQTSTEEKISAREAEITTLQQRISEVQLKMEEDSDKHIAEVNKRDQKINKLIAINIRLNETLEKIKRVSFEKKDGLIRWVDNVNRTVWINLGKADNLPIRTSFSVYSKTNEGIGRGTHDIKGSIEVTRLLEPHLAECRMSGDEDHNKPIAPGDPIYTPLWSPGGKERFSFVGKIDLDGDGKYNDRKQLHQIISSAHAEIGGEVDDEAVFTGTKIDFQTKFLVVGFIPSPEDSDDPTELEVNESIQQQLKKMKEQAREQGVRTVSLKDFLAYMGFKPSRRLWLPGEDLPWKLKSGAHSTATNQSTRNRSSSGKNAGVYTKSKRLKQPASSGQTSNLFK